MASFQDKIGWKMSRKREYKMYRSVSFLLDAKQKIPKKFKNLKNAIMASFQAKIGLIKRRKGENKYHRSVPFRSYTTRNRKFQKNSKKIQKTKKYHYGFIASENRLEKDEKERKQKLSSRLVTARRVIQNSNKIAKNLKKYHYGFISSQNRLENVGKGRI